ncbi:MAG TPA: hypothetical protein PK095_00325 [Myxococcota bacterium]|nr:hypothetical protein [Myxococcota bacterium]
MIGVASLALLWITAPPASDEPGPDSRVADSVALWREAYPGLEIEAVDGLGFALATPPRARYRARVLELILAVHDSARTFLGERVPTLTDEPWLVVVWPDKASYRRFGRRHLGAAVPDLGFADPKARLIAIDHGPGEGTLAHELMHPLLSRVFPRAPPWLTEALPALYEHKAFEPLRFFRNWRARHIRRPVSLPELFGASLSAVRADDHRHLVGLGRHLLVFLHEKGRLVDYVATLERRLLSDPKDPHLASLEALASVWPGFELEAFTRELVRWLR